jgi:hypothetical protein
MMRSFDRQPSVGVTREMQIAADAYYLNAMAVEF